MFDMTAAFISPPPQYCSSGFTDMRKGVENNIIHYYLGTVKGLSKMPPKMLCCSRSLSDQGDDYSAKLYNAKLQYVLLLTLKKLFIM